MCVIIKAFLNEDKSLLEQVKATHVLSDKVIDKLFELELNRDELIRFAKLILHKDFYNDFLKKIEIAYDDAGKPYRMISNYSSKRGKWRKKIKEAKRKKTYSSERDLVKGVVMEIFYSKPKTTIREAKVFRDHYPSVHKLLSFFHDNEVKLHRLLQFVEAYVLLDLVAKKIKSLHPDIPLFSIHDSLVTTEPNIELLEKEMDNFIYEATTIKPTLDREDWRDSIRIL